jgi:hypothetical protein
VKWIRWTLGRWTTSWHILDGTEGGQDLTRCGRWVPNKATIEHSADLPLSDKSCETCLRLEAAGLT